MKYFYDTEFYERPNKMDLISIGIVAEDGREYYAINKDADLGWIANRNPWLKDNVIEQLYDDPHESWKPTSQIRRELKEFFSPHDDDIELWAYYCAYDHVALMWIFGPMIDKPDHLPMYTHDIKVEAKRLNIDTKLPRQAKGHHNALADARWNRSAYEFIRRYRQPQPALR